MKIRLVLVWCAAALAAPDQGSTTYSTMSTAYSTQSSAFASSISSLHHTSLVSPWPTTLRTSSGISEWPSSIKTTTSVTSTKPATSTTSTAAHKVKYAGVNIAGFDFGCTTEGTCPIASVTKPGAQGVSQIKHFAYYNGLNAFRLPVAWQYLVNDVLGGQLNRRNFAAYDGLVTSCLKYASLCIIDIHNYGRWNGQIVGQSHGLIKNHHLSSLWSQLAVKYANEPKVAFGIMNEPHNLNISVWANTVQEVVTTIRKAGAKKNLVLLPGNHYSSAGAFLYDGSASSLNKVVNLDGTTDNLVFDVHAYLDEDGSGTHTTCTTNNLEIFTRLGTWLTKEGRQAFLTETGGGSTASCMRNVCEELAVLVEYSHVFLGWTGWAAGSFSTRYALSLSPFGQPGKYTDQKLVTHCIAGMFH